MRSSSMSVIRPGKWATVSYDWNTDEVIVRLNETGKDARVMALPFDKFIEAFERRIDDDRYRPISEAKRARG